MNASNESTHGLHRKKQMPFFRMLQRELFGPVERTDGAFQVAEQPAVYEFDDAARVNQLVGLTQKVFHVVEKELKLTGFWESPSARNELRSQIQQVLLAPEFARVPGLIENRERLISRAMEIAEKNNDIILYAE